MTYDRFCYSHTSLSNFSNSSIFFLCLSIIYVKKKTFGKQCGSSTLSGKDSGKYEISSKCQTTLDLRGRQRQITEIISQYRDFSNKCSKCIEALSTKSITLVTHVHVGDLAHMQWAKPSRKGPVLRGRKIANWTGGTGAVSSQQSCHAASLCSDWGGEGSASEPLGAKLIA